MRRIEIASTLAALFLLIAAMPAMATGPALTTIHTFATTDGLGPLSSLIQGSDGLLYSTTEAQGSNGFGNIFKLDNTGNNFSEVFSFDLTDGSFISGGVIEGSDGNLYGMTQAGGANGDGTIYKVATDGSGYVDLHDFGSSATDGINPTSSLVQGSDGFLYGTTFGGGAFGHGAIFKIAPGGGAITYLHSFGDNDLQIPECALVEASNGSLYGTTDGGGDGVGGIFRINLDGSGYTVLHVFGPSSADAANSFSGLIDGGDGFLYGVTAGGGPSSAGDVFKIALDGANYQDLHFLAGGAADGSFPDGPLMLGNDGNLYGTAIHSGPNGDGAIFMISRDGTAYNVLHFFDGTDGAVPQGGLLQGTDGGLYGTTFTGAGAATDGTVFSLDNGLHPSPTGLRALSSDAQVQLHWTKDTSAVTYNVYRGTTSGGENATPVATGLVLPQYFDNNVTQSTQYFYQVTAVDAGSIESVKSYEVTGTPMMSIAASNGLSASPNPATGGKPTTGTLTLTQATTGPTTAFLSSDNPNVTFTSPDVTVPPTDASTNFTINTANIGSNYTATITASENGTDASTTITVNTPPILHTFQAGLQMIAANTDDTGTTLANDFGESSPLLAVWTGSTYTMSPTAPADKIVPGQGYWFHPQSTVSLYDIGTDESDSATVNVLLVQGWNMIGNPFDVAISGLDLQVSKGANAFN
ncbi:MAG TPA: choice-of-anchor tandem repeat GloVer-containing protein, partial [Capsulimonadaceae bacterium]|nr:choice-of-anchor tandem repeat GloVer-containing protein [Capsulimonadaceae bacterium]